MNIRSTIDRQPVLTAGATVSGVILAGIAVIDATWPGTISDQQRDALVGFLVLLWPVLLAVWTKVTPVADARLPEHHPVTLPDGTAGKVTRL